MKQYNTRPIDFTGCHPVIAEHLKRSEEIRCWAWDQDCAEKPNSCHEVWIARYWQTACYPYRTTAGTFFRYAEPIPIKAKRIMPPERAIPVLIEEGWKFNEDGDLCGDNGIRVSAGMFCHLGKPINNQGVSCWEWPPCIIEEVEDDE